MRIKWIDIAKGIGIFYVLLSHSGMGFLTNHIASFFIMFFFFLSGLTFNVEKYPNLREFVKKKLKTLIFPYFIISFILFTIYIFQLLFERYFHNVLVHKEQILSQLFGIFYGKPYITAGNHTNLLNISNGPLWFLLSIFIAEVVLYIFLKGRGNALLKSILLLPAGYLLSITFPFFLPWSLDIALVGVSFMYIGYTMKKVHFNLNTKTLYLIIGLVCVNIFAFISNGLTVNVVVENYGNFILFLIGSISGTIIYMILSQYLEKTNYFSKILEYLGKNTITILGFHLLIFNILSTTPLNNLTKNSLERGLIYSVISLLIITLTISIFSRIKHNLKKTL